MTRPAASGFTLIEVLVSTAIGVVLVSSSFAAFIQIRKVTQATKVSTSLAARAAVVHDVLSNSCSAMFHGGQFRIGVSGAGTAAATVVLDLMYAQRERYPNYARVVYADDFGIDLVWHRYRFSQTGLDGRPALYRSASRSGWTVSARATSPGLYESPNWLRTIRMVSDPYDASQSVPAWTDEDVEVGTSSAEAGSSVDLAPSVRRDRRRSMLDNDTRLMPNIPKPVYRCWTTDSTGARVPCSDDELLDADYALVTDDISRFQVELVDLRGTRTIAGCDASGIPQALVYRDKAGTVLAPPPTPAAPFPDVWSSSLRVLDGLWSDGRSTPCPFPGASVPAPALERPALIRISFRLSDRDSGRYRDFSFSLPTTTLTVAE